MNMEIRKCNGTAFREHFSFSSPEYDPTSSHYSQDTDTGTPSSSGNDPFSLSFASAKIDPLAEFFGLNNIRSPLIVNQPPSFDVQTSANYGFTSSTNGPDANGTAPNSVGSIGVGTSTFGAIGTPANGAGAIGTRTNGAGLIGTVANGTSAFGSAGNGKPTFGTTGSGLPSFGAVGNGSVGFGVLGNGTTAQYGLNGFGIGSAPRNPLMLDTFSPNNSSQSESTGSPCTEFNPFIGLSRSNSPASSDGSAHSADGNVNGYLNPSVIPLTEQELKNIQNLHLLNAYAHRLVAAEKNATRCDSSTCCKSNYLKSILEFQHRLKSDKQQYKSLDTAARFHRTAAVSGHREATCTWSGKLAEPDRSSKNGGYSCKVFLGGVPWDITEDILLRIFSKFGPVKVDWPGKDNGVPQPKGYSYLLFESDKQVKCLLECSTYNSSKGGCWFYKISSRRIKSKEVQVIPWCLSDSNYVQTANQKLDAQRTVFVGALHGMMNAKSLYNVMNDLFGGVVYAGIDTDKHKYPIGSARVTFGNYHSYMKAVHTQFIEIKTKKFSKIVQVDPYLEDSPCSLCMIQQGPYFCKEKDCYRYFCTQCWRSHHSAGEYLQHSPMMRASKHTAMSSPPRTPRFKRQNLW